jgi:hypothetical protein
VLWPSTSMLLFAAISVPDIVVHGLSDAPASTAAVPVFAAPPGADHAVFAHCCGSVCVM